MVNSEEFILRLLDYGAVAIIAVLIVLRLQQKLDVMIEKLSRIEAKLELLASNPKRGEEHV